jgi:hypothetical protein
MYRSVCFVSPHVGLVNYCYCLHYTDCLGLSFAFVCVVSIFALGVLFITGHELLSKHVN